MHFGAIAPLVVVVSGTWPAFATALQRSAIHDDSAGLALSALTDADDGAYVAHHRLKAVRLISAPELLVHHRPGRQVIGQHAPGSARTGKPAKGIEHLAQALTPLGCLLVNQGQVRCHEVPFLVAHITGVGFSRHPQHIRALQKISAPGSKHALSYKYSFRAIMATTHKFPFRFLQLLVNCNTQILDLEPFPVMANLLLYSANPWIKHVIQDNYRGGRHYVWCSDHADSRILNKYSLGANVPSSSNPIEIYQGLKAAVSSRDRHNSKIVEVKATYQALLLPQWIADGTLGEFERDEILYLLENAEIDYWRPVLYLIPRSSVEKRLEPVPASKRAGIGMEYIIGDLHSDEFEFVEVP